MSRPSGPSITTSILDSRSSSTAPTQKSPIRFVSPNGPSSRNSPSEPLLQPLRDTSCSSSGYQSIPRPPKRPILPRIETDISSFSSIKLQSYTRRKEGREFKIFISILILVVISLLAWDISTSNCFVEPLCRVLGDGPRNDEVWWRNSGSLAPWRSLGKGGGRRGLPGGCKINQVIILHRHAARYPTTTASEPMLRALNKLARRKIDRPRQNAELAFLVNTDLELKSWRFNQLLDQGRKQAWKSGREIAALYEQYFPASGALFSRSAGQQRVEESAGYWLEGFKGQSFKIKPFEALPKVNVVLPEIPGFNNTLSTQTCPAASKEPSRTYPDLLEKLEPALQRLNDVLEPQPLLDITDLLSLADMCSFESQISQEWETWSRWCRIFTTQEWEIIGHLKDVDKYYGIGQGSRFGATLGAGWVNELIARLSDSQPIDWTTTNHTLDEDPESFPRGGKRIFVDFTHDNEMLEIITALGLVKQQEDLPVDDVPKTRQYEVSRMIPFGSRIVFERISCSASYGEDEEENHIRILINDNPQMMDTPECSQSRYARYGLCELNAFLQSQSWAREEVDWSICYNDT